MAKRAKRKRAKKDLPILTLSALFGFLLLLSSELESLPTVVLVLLSELLTVVLALLSELLTFV